MIEENLSTLMTQICAELSQRPNYHVDRLTLLAYPAGQWHAVDEWVTQGTKISATLNALAEQGLQLFAMHLDTPDDEWSLVNFYCPVIDSIPATALLLKRAHKQAPQH